MAETEAQFERAVVELAELQGWRVYHTRDSRGSNPGFPDLVMARGTQAPGALARGGFSRLVFAELKSAKGRVSPAQQAWLDDLREVEVEVYLWRPSDWPAIERTLR